MPTCLTSGILPNTFLLLLRISFINLEIITQIFQKTDFLIYCHFLEENLSKDFHLLSFPLASVEKSQNRTTRRNCKNSLRNHFIFYSNIDNVFVLLKVTTWRSRVKNILTQKISPQKISPWEHTFKRIFHDTFGDDFGN